MLATLIYAERAQGRYIKQVHPLHASIWSSPNYTRINYHAREAINENKQRRSEAHRIQGERLDWILSWENKFLTGLKAGRNEPSFKPISKEAKTLLVEEVTPLKKV